MTFASPTHFSIEARGQADVVWSDFRALFAQLEPNLSVLRLREKREHGWRWKMIFFGFFDMFGFFLLETNLFFHIFLAPLINLEGLCLILWIFADD